jgi:serine protease
MTKSRSLFYLAATLFSASAAGALVMGAPGTAQADDPPEPSAQVGGPVGDPLGGPVGDPLGGAERDGRDPLYPGAGRPARGASFGEPVAVASDSPLWADAAELDEAGDDVPGTLVVDARDELDSGSIAALAAEFGIAFTPTDLEAETRAQLAEVGAGRMADLMESLSRDPRVEIVEPLGRIRMSFVPNDPLMGEQWHMERIGASKAWDFATGRGVTVAVVDTGIACETHGPFIKGTDLAHTECVGGWNFVNNSEHANDDQGHGTHVAGTIAQTTNNGFGAAGIAFHARLMPVKVLNGDGWGTTADVADGIRWAAANGAQVINLSLGGPRNSRVLQKAIDYALSRGVVVVAAAGNTGGKVQFPGASDGVVGVSAIDSKDKIASFSSRGEGVDIAAPGVGVMQQTICNRGRDKCERFVAFNGTSMAAPHVAGAAALIVGLGVTDPAAVEEALRSNARVVDNSEEGKRLYGAGILHAGGAAERVTKTHAMVRLVALLLLTLFVARSARKKSPDATSPFGLGFLIPALAAGVGLFFFAPWILPRVSLPVDVLARPIADLDFLIGASLHRFLPFANALVPFALTAVLFGVPKARPFIAGIATGTAAYLASVIYLGEAFGPFGRTALIAWCALNAFVCLWIARTNLAESR